MILLKRITTGLLSLSIAAGIFACSSPQLLGPCLMAREYRSEAEKRMGNERAVFEGKALAAERECQEQNDRMIQMQRNMREMESRQGTTH